MQLVEQKIEKRESFEQEKNEFTGFAAYKCADSGCWFLTAKSRSTENPKPNEF
jgi:hypothetical protein